MKYGEGEKTAVRRPHDCINVEFSTRAFFFAFFRGESNRVSEVRKKYSVEEAGTEAVMAHKRDPSAEKCDS